MWFLMKISNALKPLPLNPLAYHHPISCRDTDFHLSDIYHIFHKEHAYIATS